MGYSDVCNLHWKVCWVVNCNKHLDLGILFKIRDWTIFVSRIVSKTPLPVICNESALISPEVESLSVHRVCVLELVKDLARVIICYVLSTSASCCIVMLNYTNSIHHFILGGFCLLSKVWILDDFLIDRVEGENFVWRLEGMLRAADVLFIVCSRGEVTCPIWVLVICVGEHVVVLSRPGEIVCEHGIHIHRRSWVDQLNVV